MEFDKFIEIRQQLCVAHPKVTEGRMMSSPAIHYNGKVIAFFSRNQKMVFKLGKDFSIDEEDPVVLSEFNPFKKKKPLAGWYEIGYEHHGKWHEYARKALDLIKSD